MFETTDLWLAASLLSVGFDIKSIDKDNNQGVFVFEETTNFSFSLNDYINGKLLVEPKTLSQNIKMLKTMI